MKQSKYGRCDIPGVNTLRRVLELLQISQTLESVHSVPAEPQEIPSKGPTEGPHLDLVDGRPRAELQLFAPPCRSPRAQAMGHLFTEIG